MTKRVRLAVVAVLIPAVFLFFVSPYLQSSETQARKQQEKFVQLGAKRSWEDVKKLLAADYHDQWKQKPADAVDLCSKVLQGFIYLKIDWKPIDATVKGNTVILRGTAHMSGSGGGISQIVMDTVNQVKEPWVFTWRKDGWKPSDWKLISVENKELPNEVPKLE
jgi:hypothetical protein